MQLFTVAFLMANDVESAAELTVVVVVVGVAAGSYAVCALWAPTAATRATNAATAIPATTGLRRMVGVPSPHHWPLAFDHANTSVSSVSAVAINTQVFSSSWLCTIDSNRRG